MPATRIAPATSVPKIRSDAANRTKALSGKIMPHLFVGVQAPMVLPQAAIPLQRKSRRHCRRVTGFASFVQRNTAEKVLDADHIGVSRLRCRATSAFTRVCDAPPARYARLRRAMGERPARARLEWPRRLLVSLRHSAAQQ